MGIAAMAALTSVSCSSEDLNSVSDNSSKNEAISFDGYLGRSAVAVMVHVVACWIKMLFRN